MGANKIDVYYGKTAFITYTITAGIASLAGYTPWIKVLDDDEVEKFSVQGTANGLVISFIIPKANHEIDPDTYIYEITIDNGVYEFSVEQDQYEVLKSY